MKKEYDIFINYRRVGGKEFARMLALDLERRGYKVFLDFDELTDGKFDKRIMDAIENAPIFISILSAGALDRCANSEDWVRREIEYALALGRQIIPINPDHQFSEFPSDLPPMLRMGLGQHQISEVMLTGSLFKVTMDKLVEDRIAAWFAEHSEHAHHGGETSEKKACLKLRTNADCRILIDDEEVVTVLAGRITRLPLAAGGYWLQAVPTDTLLKSYETELRMEAQDKLLRIEFNLTPSIHAEKANEIKHLYQMGRNYYNGVNGYDKDFAQAVEWYRKAAEQGYAPAYNSLGVCYDNGRGVPQDYAKAVEWYRKAAEQGFALAQYNLGQCYKNGEGVLQDYAKAVEWWRKAAEQGLVNAQYNLGVSYACGRGIPQDMAKAVEWWREAAKQGDEDAQEQLRRMGETW